MTMTEKKTKVQDLFVPWLLTAPEYSTAILDKAWAQPECGRMMLNENPVPPSEKVVDAVTEIVKKGNRYPDSMLRLKTKLAELHGVGPENIALANGSSETIDAAMRIFMQPGDQFLLFRPDVRDVSFAGRPVRCQERPDSAARIGPAVRRRRHACRREREDQADADHQPQ